MSVLAVAADLFVSCTAHQAPLHVLVDSNNTKSLYHCDCMLLLMSILSIKYGDL